MAGENIHKGTDNYLWDVQNRTRIGNYLTNTEIEYIKEALGGSAGKNVLDLGCGSGKISFRLRDMGYDVVGLEYDLEPLLGFRQQSKTAKIVNCDAQSLPFADESFDVILAIQMLDYLPDRKKFYREAWRTLRPGGLLLFTLTNRRSIKGAVYDLYLRMTGRKRMRRYYEMNYEEGLAEMNVANFSILGSRGYNWNLLPRDADNILVDIFAWAEKALGFRNCPSLSPLVFVVARKSLS